MFKHLYTLLSFSLIFFSCTNSENAKLVVGEWHASEWLIGGQPSNLQTESTGFKFTDKGEYTFVYGAKTETGTYKVENDMLFTTPKGEQEIMVKIYNVTQDSLVFDMNRGGQQERLTLLKFIPK